MLDFEVRENLKHLSTSKLVKAPAGSGKTTESVKYFLNSLLDCKYPESTFFMTFTNQATSEFRERVISYLRIAQSNTPPKSAHEMDMYSLAKKVLQRDKELGWGLLSNPNRLEIKTIDALCANIVASSPLGSEMGAVGKVSERPQELYLCAAKKLLSGYEGEGRAGADIRNLLSKFNNNFEMAAKTLAEMLPYRDQWLPLVYQHTESERKAKLEEHNAKLMLILSEPGMNILSLVEDKIFDILELTGQFTREPNFTFSNVTQIDDSLICSLAAVKNFLFTKELKLRKSFTKAQGLKAASSFKDPDEKAAAKELKESAVALLSELSATPLEEEGQIFLRICDPHYTESEWSMLTSILEILPRLTGELLLAFKAKGECDFVEMQTAALRALGDETSPGKALLRLDNRLRHILVDEFQDCSPFQLQLLKRLTSGWLPDDGRTLYLVGDPMQSIYLFRGSDVGLFIGAAENGIGDIPLSVHQLTSNYRSQAGLIDWVNEKFEQSFGDIEDRNIGATTYNPSEACKPRIDDEAVSMTLYSGHGWEQSQAKHIVNEIHKITNQEPDATIAVLGRTRSDLADVIEQMKANEVHHKAIDIHKLTTLSCITDLTALTRSICHLADKQAWVGLMRSHFVGLSLKELEIACTCAGEQRARTKDVLLYNLSNERVQEALEPQSRDRLKVVLRVIRKSQSHLGRKSLDKIVKGAFYALGGLSLLKDKSELRAIESFFAELAKMSIDTFSVDRLAEHVSTLYAPVEQSNGKVTVSTKHKAKGLEFDYVFIPHAHKPIRPSHTTLINFETITQDDAALAILSPDTKSTLEQTRMNHFIRAFKNRKAQQEAIRLAYVACTRAKKKMFISGESKSIYPVSSMLGILSVTQGQCLEVSSEQEFTSQKSSEPQRALLSNPNTKLLPEGDSLASFRGIIHTENENLPTMNWLKEGNRIIGIVVHKAIETIAHLGWDTYFANDLSKYRSLWRVQLFQEGLQESNLVYAIREIEYQLTKLKKSDYMSWVLQQENIEVEKPIYIKTLGKLKKYILDITFTVENTRYLIDTKTSRPEDGESHEEFAKRMLATHAEKMNSYKKCFLDAKQIEIGLYLSSIGKMAVYNFEYKKAA